MGCFFFFLFRNYVLQHVLGLDDPQVTNKICLRLKGHYAQLSSQKGGSYVVEKCLNSVGMNYVIEDFLSYNRLCQLARDRFGNYVIQAALKATKVNILNYIAMDISDFMHTRKIFLFFTADE